MNAQSIPTIGQVDLSNKTVLIRADLNVPIADGQVVSDVRIKASLDTINYALKQGAFVLICSHLGRPKEGSYDKLYSLKPVADYLSNALKMPVPLVKDYLTDEVSFEFGKVALLENVRFNVGEKSNSEQLSAGYAKLCDVFVMDAFGSAHRAQASTEGVIRACQSQNKPVCAGLLLQQELTALDRALDNPKPPVLAIVGGSKVSTKLEVLYSLADICDTIVVGGGIANTFLVASGFDVGASLYEPDLIDSAKALMQKTQILLPKCVVTAHKDEVDFDDFLGSLKKAKATTKSVEDIKECDMILDTAPSCAKNIAQVIALSKTILWNGPLGVFEVDAFGQGTKILADAIAKSEGYSIAGGGDTLAAVDKYDVADFVDYLSTGGGAFLEFVEGKQLPAIKALLG